MPGVDFEAMRREITMAQVLDLLRFEAANSNGSQLRGPCPVHRSTSSHSRSCSVNLAAGRYFCHKCKSHGNQLELWAPARGLSIYDAVVDHCLALGRRIPWVEPPCK